MRRSTALRSLLAACLAATAAAGISASASSATSGAADCGAATAATPDLGTTPTYPTKDCFYRYTASTPLAKIPLGTPLKKRSVTIGLSTHPTPLPAEQILYRTEDGTGQPVVSVTTVVLPATQTVTPKVVAYLSAYDALSPKCDPSYTLRGGDPDPNNTVPQLEQGLVQSLRANGFIVTVPDFEDERLDYVAGIESGRSSLDGIKATIAALTLPASTPIGLEGYSGGSIAADWASELQPTYAPALHMVGTAMGGIPVNLLHTLTYINGEAGWAQVMPAALQGIARSYHFDLTPYLSAYGKKIVAGESDQCIGDMAQWGNMTLKQLMKPQYADVPNVPVFRQLLGRLTMGTTPGHPSAPFLMMWGDSDGTGDGVMIAKDEAALAAHYCNAGLAVLSQQFNDLNHVDVIAPFVPAAQAWLTERFTGAPAPSNCAGSMSIK
jgi:hypothetical protein